MTEYEHVALLRCLVELEYAQEKLGNDRSFTRLAAPRNARAALKHSEHNPNNQGAA